MLALRSRLPWFSLTALVLGCSTATAPDPAPVVDDHPQAPPAAPGATTKPPVVSPAAPDAPRGPVQVAVVFGPKEGIPVLFHDSDGAVIGQTKTGADGVATAPDTIAPAQVSALIGYDGYHQIVTWTGVARGDLLRVRNVLAPKASTISIKLTLPGDTAGAKYYRAGSAPCFESMALASTGSQSFYYATCWSDKNAVLAEALGSDGVIAYAFAKGLPLPSAPDTPVTLTAWVAPEKLTLDALNPPAGMDAYTSVELDVDGTYYSASGLNTHDYAAPPGFADRYIGHAYAFRRTGPTSDIQSTLSIQQVIPGKTRSTIDYGRALPELTASTTSLADPKRPAVSWKSAAPLTEADGGIVSFSWGSSAMSTGGPISYSPDSGRWEIYVPAGATSVKAPSLPAEYAAWLPLETKTGQGMLRFDAVDYFVDYAAYRQAIAGEEHVVPKVTDVRTTGTLGSRL